MLLNGGILNSKHVSEDIKSLFYNDYFRKSYKENIYTMKDSIAIYIDDLSISEDQKRNLLNKSFHYNISHILKLALEQDYTNLKVISHNPSFDNVNPDEDGILHYQNYFDEDERTNMELI